MDPITIGAGLAALGKLIDKVIPDRDAAAKAKLELLRLQEEGELRLAEGQLEINKIEAASDSVFVAGWRPAVGWVSVLGVLWNVIGQPFFAWVSGMVEIAVPPPADLELLLFLLGTLLGVSGLRTAEKIKGVAAR